MASKQIHRDDWWIAKERPINSWNSSNPLHSLLPMTGYYPKLGRSNLRTHTHTYIFNNLLFYIRFILHRYIFVMLTPVMEIIVRHSNSYIPTDVLTTETETSCAVRFYIGKPCVDYWPKCNNAFSCN